MKRIDRALLTPLCDAASARPRRRLNHNLHPSPDAAVQRLCNALEPGTYVHPHRHVNPPGPELFIAILGRAFVLLFDFEGAVIEREEISAEGPVFGLEIPGGAWHTLGCLEPGTVLFEIKEGPYRPTTDKDFAPWAPPETSPLAAAAEEWLRHAQIGDRPPTDLSSFKEPTDAL